jgi:hypothetical protein
MMPSTETTLRFVCEAWGTTKIALCGTERTPQLSAARAALFHLLPQSDVVAGRVIDKNHKSVAQARTRARTLLASDPQFAARVDAIRAALAEEANRE